MQLFGRTRENECRQELLSAGRELLSPSAEGEREEGFLLAGAERLSPCPKKEVEERKESFSGEFSLLRPKKEVDNSQEEGEKEVSLSWHGEVGQNGSARELPKRSFGSTRRKVVPEWNHKSFRRFTYDHPHIL